jgi:hypothetical protein
MFNWPGADENDWNFTLRPIFKPYEIDREFTYPTKGFWERFKMNYRIKVFKRPRTRGAAVASILFDRILLYVGSPEFKYCFDLPDSFVGRNLIILIHMWMLLERLSVLAAEYVNKHLPNIPWYKRYLVPSSRREY